MPIWWDGEALTTMGLCVEHNVHFPENNLSPFWVRLTTMDELGVSDPPWDDWMHNSLFEVGLH